MPQLPPVWKRWTGSAWTEVSRPHGGDANGLMSCPSGNLYLAERTTSDYTNYTNYIYKVESNHSLTAMGSFTNTASYGILNACEYNTEDGPTVGVLHYGYDGSHHIYVYEWDGVSWTLLTTLTYAGNYNRMVVCNNLLYILRTNNENTGSIYKQDSIGSSTFTAITTDYPPVNMFVVPHDRGDLFYYVSKHLGDVSGSPGRYFILHKYYPDEDESEFIWSPNEHETGDIYHPVGYDGFWHEPIITVSMDGTEVIIHWSFMNQYTYYDSCVVYKMSLTAEIDNGES
jgi:hypothetical protein